MDTRKNQKWITDANGFLQLNPYYEGPVSQPSKTSSPNALPIVSTIQEAQGLRLTPETNQAIVKIQGPQYTEAFHAQVDGSQMLEGLTDVFRQHETPLGLVDMVSDLAEKPLLVVLDDSPSMTFKSDVKFSQASDYIKKKYAHLYRNPDECLTRWHEAENRLYNMGQHLKFVPITTLTISLLNRKGQQFQFALDRRGKTAEIFGAELERMLSTIFALGVDKDGSTPLYGKLLEEFTKPRAGQTMLYVLTDGEPNDCDDIEQIQDLIVFRGPRPTGTFDQIFAETEKRCALTPLNLLSCTNKPHEAAWMKTIEGIAFDTSEIDDLASETHEVQGAQGPRFRYTEGLDLIRQMVAPLHPVLDGMDEGTLPKYLLDKIYGRITTPQEYQAYFYESPKHGEVAHLFQQYASGMPLDPRVTQEQRRQILQKYLKENPNITPPHRYMHLMTLQVGGYSSTQTHAYPPNNNWQAQAPVNSWQAQPNWQQEPQNSWPNASQQGFSSSQNPPPYNPQWSASQPQTQNWNSAPPQNFNQAQQGWNSSQQQNFTAPPPQQGYNSTNQYPPYQQQPQQQWPQQAQQQNWNAQQQSYAKNKSGFFNNIKQQGLNTVNTMLNQATHPNSQTNPNYRRPGM